MTLSMQIFQFPPASQVLNFRGFYSKAPKVGRYTLFTVVSIRAQSVKYVETFIGDMGHYAI
jgi:hypothetical protein